MFKIIAYNFLILFILLLFLEIILKSNYPLVHGGIYYNYYNNIKINPSLPDPYILKKNKKFRHVSNEFNSIITSTNYGNRISNENELSETLIFIGDSFTFGHGVNDDETFAHLFCNSKSIRCVNLGKSGTDQGSQLEILKNYLKNVNVKIYRINLFLFMSCNLYSSGNDLKANLKRYSEVNNLSKKIISNEESFSLFNIQNVIDQSKSLVRKSEILKRITSIFIANLKSNLQSCSSSQELNSSFVATKFYLEKIIEVGKNNNAIVKLYSIFPYYELQNESSKVLINNFLITNNLNILNINNLEIDDYYKFDGHLNKNGHKKIFEFLLKDY